MRKRALLGLAFLLAVTSFGSALVRAPAARADGDPGSDVLVYQPLFLASDARISIVQQVQLDALLHRAQSDGFPIRVAIISSRSDLGAVTSLWRKPRAYACFLGLELSLAYRGRLVVVMPNGLGFNWPGHSAAQGYRMLGGLTIRAGGAGLASAAQGAVKTLAAADGIKLAARQAHAGPARSVNTKGGTGAFAAHGSGAEETIVLIVLAVLCAVPLGMRLWRVWRTRRRQPGPDRSPPPATEPPPSSARGPAALRAPRPGLALAGVTVVAAGVAAGVVLAVLGSPGTARSDALARNPYLDPGTTLSRAAPAFALTDQFGQPVSLRSFRGRVVLLAFTDSECTTICPLTTTAMLDAKAMLGAAGSRVQLLGIDANPKATALDDVFSYSRVHGMLHAWHFLTGSLAQLRQVWGAYGVQAAIQAGEIAHTPALFVIDPRGRELKLYLTQQSYAAVGQLGQLLAQEASRLLPGHPAVDSHLSYARIAGITPSVAATLPHAGGGNIRIGPSRSPRLYLFFATWDQETMSLAGHLDALNRYQDTAAHARLPALTAIDEGSVEPFPTALGRFLAGLPRPLAYPVAIDRSGRVADGYQVQGQPWFVLTTPTGRILWYRQVATTGWPSPRALARDLRAALARVPSTSASKVQRQLAGSPPALQALHRQASRLLGGEPALAARIRALRGYPIVINAWASWCTPCRAEASLFAAASARYGRRVAFIGADTDDSGSGAGQFLAQHPVSYPSYQSTITDLAGIFPQGLAGLPTTIFLNRAGKVVYVHAGQYASQGTLDADIQNFALGG
ncbi:MAG: redoxin domain-containing protein [Solirubrobacterales bacterium]|nr:redoxin domain-containing protein [Solirubrobacterales bacterium]